MENTVRKLAAVFDKEVARKAYAIRKKTSSVVSKQQEYIVQLLDQNVNNNKVIAENKHLNDELDSAKNKIKDLIEDLALMKKELTNACNACNSELKKYSNTESNTTKACDSELKKYSNTENNTIEMDSLRKENKNLKAHNVTHQNTIKDLKYELKKSVTIEYNMNEEGNALKKEIIQLKARNDTLQNEVLCFKKGIKSKDSEIAKLKLQSPRIPQTDNMNIVKTQEVAFNPAEKIIFTTSIQKISNENFELKRKIGILEAEATCFDPTNSTAKVNRLLKDKTAAKRFIEYQREGYHNALEQLDEAKKTRI